MASGMSEGDWIVVHCAWKVDFLLSAIEDVATFAFQLPGEL